MSRLPVLSGAEAIRAFERAGYREVRQSGSHVVLEHPGRRPLSVPLHRELKRGLVRALIRDAGLSVEEFGFSTRFSGCMA